MLGTVLITSTCVTLGPHKAGNIITSQFTDKEGRAQRSQFPWPKSQSLKVRLIYLASEPVARLTPPVSPL